MYKKNILLFNNYIGQYELFKYFIYMNLIIKMHS